MPAYDGARAAMVAFRSNNVPGDPDATDPGILRVVDAQAPPLRIFFGSVGLPLMRAEYASRIETWEKWNDVSLEAQGDWANLKGSNTSAIGTFGGVPFANQTKIDSIGLFTGQVGYAWNNVLWYVKGGAAVTDDKYRGTVTATGALFDSASETRWGGVVGTGLEYGFAPNWSVAVEYDHLFMGNHSRNFTSTGVLAVVPVGGVFRTDSIRQDVDLITARINYRFNWGGPVVGRY